MKGLFSGHKWLISTALMGIIATGTAAQNTATQDKAAQTTAAQGTAGSYRLCDFHQHTTFSDGRFSIRYDFAMCDSLGLAWWANSEHGGPSEWNGLTSGDDTGTRQPWQPADIVGDADPDAPGKHIMWRWQTLLQYSFPHIAKAREQYGTKTIIQGVEWNVPGHEHASLSIIDHQFDSAAHCRPIAEFEYRFDSRDRDVKGGASMGWTKSTNEGHAKAIEAIGWLKARYPMTSWVIPAHPDRKSRWTAADFRQMNDLAPTVCFGFEAMPGHQRSADRGEYAPRNNTYGTYTYGGAGLMLARVGGLWDALLSEGRRWWIYSCSDFHQLGSDFLPGEYNRTYLYLPHDFRPQHLAHYLRSGNCFIVGGNFVSGLSFEIEGTPMGGTLAKKKKEGGTRPDSITLSIRVRENPAQPHRLHHIDLIAGEVHTPAQPGTAAYAADSVETTRIVRRFTAHDWTRNEAGDIVITHRLLPSAPHTYYRLRGTHHPLGQPGETDAEGNPLPDGPHNTEAKAWADQWLYSNPIFVKVEQLPTNEESIINR